MSEPGSDALALIGIDRWQLRRPAGNAGMGEAQDEREELLSLAEPVTAADQALWAAIARRLGLGPGHWSRLDAGTPGTLVCHPDSQTFHLNELRQDPMKKRALWETLNPLLRGGPMRSGQPD